MAADLAGLILAGGAGTRFGGPKAFARLPDGRTFLQACGDTLRAAGAAPIAATLPAGAGGGDPTLVAVALPGPGLPMFESLVLGLRRLLRDSAWERVVVLPVDHPLVASATVHALAAAGADAAIPCYRGKHGHPVALVRAVAGRIAAGELPGPTLREVLRAVGVRDVEVDDPGVTANCNTPEALAAALAAARGTPPAFP